MEAGRLVHRPSGAMNVFLPLDCAAIPPLGFEVSSNDLR